MTRKISADPSTDGNIYLDGTQVWTSGTMSKSFGVANPPLVVDLDLTGKTNLTLRSTSTGATGKRTG